MTSSMMLMLAVCAALLHHTMGQALATYSVNISQAGGNLTMNTSAMVVFENGTFADTVNVTAWLYNWYSEDSQNTFLMPTDPHIYSDVLRLQLGVSFSERAVPLKPVRLTMQVKDAEVADPAATNRRATTSVTVQDVITGMWYDYYENSWMNLEQCNYVHSTTPKTLECTLPVDTLMNPANSGYYVAMRLTYEQVIEYVPDKPQQQKLHAGTVALFVISVVLAVTGLGLVCDQTMRRRTYSAVEDDL
jgi:hypothetical protein